MKEILLALGITAPSAEFYDLVGYHVRYNRPGAHVFESGLTAEQCRRLRDGLGPDLNWIMACVLK